jgi:hypothetical protein
VWCNPTEFPERGVNDEEASAISFVLLVALLVATVAGAKENERRVPMLLDPASRGVPMPGVMGVNQGTDTFFYGGTVLVGGVPYAAAPTAAGRANAKMWTWAAGGWNGTPHSGRNMDGWTGKDNTAQTENYFRVMDNTTLGQTRDRRDEVAFCRTTGAEAATLLRRTRWHGYGNNWNRRCLPGHVQRHGADQRDLLYTHDRSGYDYVYVVANLRHGSERLVHVRHHMTYTTSAEPRSWTLTAT